MASRGLRTLTRNNSEQQGSEKNYGTLAWCEEILKKKERSSCRLVSDFNA
jgi:hypothetical protein